MVGEWMRPVPQAVKGQVLRQTYQQLGLSNSLMPHETMSPRPLGLLGPGVGCGDGRPNAPEKLV